MLSHMMNRCLIALLGVLLIATGCSSASDEGTSIESTSEEAVAEAEAASDSGDDSSTEGSDDNDSGDSGDNASADDGTPMAASSPIGAFFNDGGGFEQTIADYTIKVEEEIVLCMAAEGFEFRQSTPQRPEIQRLQNELSEREWTKQFGYGISTAFASLVQDQGGDPNAEIFFSMQPAEREAWTATLAGEDPSLQGIDNDRPLEEQGCIGQAIIATGGQEVFSGLDEVGQTYEEGLEGIYDDPNMITAVADWTRCMSEGGYPDYSEVDSPEEDIGKRLNELTAGLDAAIDAMSPEEGQALIDGDNIDLEDLPGLDVEALRKLQEEELKVAVADLDCFEAHVADVFYPLRDAFERGLLDEYQSQFNALRNIGG